MLKVVDKLWKQNEKKEKNKTNTKKNQKNQKQKIIYIIKNEIYIKKYIVIYIHTHTIYMNILNEGYAADIQQQQQQKQPQDTKNNVKMCIHYENRRK